MEKIIEKLKFMVGALALLALAVLLSPKIAFAGVLVALGVALFPPSRKSRVLMRRRWLLGASVALIGCGVLVALNCFSLSTVFAALSAHPVACAMAAGPIMLTEEQLTEFKQMLGDIKEGWGNVKTLPKQVKELEGKLNDVRRLQAAGVRGTSSGVLRAGQFVSDSCAEWLGAMAVLGAEKQNKLADHKEREELITRSNQILDRVEQRSALTSSDIPLPVVYSNEVIALVNQYGDARRYATVIPLGAGVVKLPKLNTDPAFGLITGSGTVTEKSPQTAYVTFTAEKFGGLIRIPSEMTEDSLGMLGQFIANYAARNIALVEDQVFWMNLDGSTYGAVKGLCGSTITNSKVTQMASTNTHYSDATLANFRTLRTVCDAAALRTAAYYLHPTFEALLATFNTSGNRPYNPQAQIQGTGAQPIVNGPTLDGFPIRWVSVMPSYSTSANVSKVFALFGEPNYQFLGIRGSIRFDYSMDAAFATDEILVRSLERFTIGLMAVGAVGGLQTAAS